MDKQKESLIQYGLIVIFSNGLGLIGIVFISYIFDILIPTMIIALTQMVLRPSAGGAHCSSPFNCNFLGFAIIPVLGYGVSLFLNASETLKVIYITAAFMIGLYGILKNAPYFTQNKPRALSRNRLLKNRSMVFSLIIYILSSVFLFKSIDVWSIGLSTALLWQGLMLLPVGIGSINFLDSCLNRLLSEQRR